MQTLRRTPLYERHAALGARLVPFAGWEMPVQYTSIREEHRAVRTSAGVFDVSHMGQLELTGAGAHEYLQGRLSNDLDRIDDGRAQYTLLTNDRGGIVDDLIAYRRGHDDYLLVVNASNVEPDHEVLSDTSDVSADWDALAQQAALLREEILKSAGRFVRKCAQADLITSDKLFKIEDQLGVNLRGRRPPAA